MTELPPLDEDLRSLLEAERRTPLREDLPAIRARARAKVLARVGGPGWGPVLSAAVGLAVGLGLGALLTALLLTLWPQERVLLVPVALPVPVPVPAPAVPAPVAPRVVPEPIAPEPIVSGPTAEAVLLERARVALLRGDPKEALVTLMGHERQFPQGDLSEEREVLIIEAQLALGRREEALSRATLFRERHPRSVHLGRLPEP